MMALVKKVREPGGRSGGSGVARETSSARLLSGTTEPCSHVCPCGTDVRGFLTALANGGERGLTEAQAIEEAFYIIAERNPIPAVLGRLCPHHCETGCTPDPDDGGVSVSQIERAIAEAAINAAWPLRRIATTSAPVAVTVVGAGVSGLSAAYQLARRGHDVTLADPHPEAGGELRYGLDAARLPRPVLDAEVERILALGVKFAASADVEAIESARDRRVIKTRVYEKGAPVALGAVAAAVHFGRVVAELVDAEARGSTIRPTPEPAQAGTRKTVDLRRNPPKGGPAGDEWTPETAIRGAQQCLSCGASIECDSQWTSCPDQAVIRPLGQGHPYRFTLEFCQGCNECADRYAPDSIEIR
jgi:Pyruvate/2-oxoacid:ferredoxin oxidoreductase delta subunit